MRVAITGSTGYVGSRVLAALTAQGHEAFAVRRGPATDPQAMWDPDVGWVRPGLLEGVDAVVCASGTSIAAKRWTAARRRELRASRIDSAHVLVEHMRTLARPPRVLVTASATGYYGDGGDRVLAEDAPKGEGFLAQLVADWEAEAMQAAAFGTRVVPLRFGPLVARDSELIQRLLLPFCLGVGGRLGSGKQWFSWVATEDVVRVIEFALTHEAIAGPVNVTAPQPVTNLEFTRALGHALHRPTVFPVPALALRLLFGRALAGEALLVSQRAVPQRLLAAGFEFQYPTIEAALAAAFPRRGGRPSRPASAAR